MFEFMKALSPLQLALIANLSFATASIYFTEYSQKVSAIWVNFFKASISAILFGLVCFWFGNLSQLNSQIIFWLSLSGMSGLMIGDIFLFGAYVELGAGRTLMLFSFQPLFLGIASHFFFGEVFDLQKLWALLFMAGCMFSFGMENAKQKGCWEWSGIRMALIGIFLDAAGLLMTKHIFQNHPGISPFLVNWIRAVAATIGFILVATVFKKLFKKKFSLTAPLKKLSHKQIGILAMASALGTFFALSMYLRAVQTGNLATVSAVTGTAPLFASFIEILRGKKKWNRYFAAGLGCFLIGFWLLQ